MYFQIVMQWHGGNLNEKNAIDSRLPFNVFNHYIFLYAFDIDLSSTDLISIDLLGTDLLGIGMSKIHSSSSV